MYLPASIIPPTLLFFLIAALAQQYPTLPRSYSDSRNLAPNIFPRALPDSPNGTYAPAEVTCPSSRPAIRSAGSGLSPEETAWLGKRRPVAIAAMKDFLARSNITGFDVSAYFTKNEKDLKAMPNIGLAFSGGGYRALMNGAGFIAAADSRVPGSMNASGLGGLLQSSTYIAGLSGGSWLVGSIYANNFSDVQTLRDSNVKDADSDVWDFAQSIVNGPKKIGVSIWNSAKYWGKVHETVKLKSDAGFDTSITDYWGRALSYQLIGDSDGGPAYTFSSIALNQGFADGKQPMPVVVADERGGRHDVNLTTAVLEFNPWEMGTFDPNIYGFAPLRYLGSNFTNGKVPTNGSCVTGFDQIGYILGTSSSLFNAPLLSSFGSSSLVRNALREIVKHLGDGNEDVAQYGPNPFRDWNPTGMNGVVAQSPELTLADGGENMENIPLQPLIHPERGLDVIFAVDSSADTDYHYPNGTALRATYERSKISSVANGTQFPAVPDAKTFVDLGLNTRPAFFGCDVKKFTTNNSSTTKSTETSCNTVPPLIVYVPNAPYTTFSNVSTFNLTYTNEQRNAIIQNGFNVATMGNGTAPLNTVPGVDSSTWRTCAGCAVMQRVWARSGAQVPAVCETCFKEFCWNGTVSTQAVESYEPGLKLPAQEV